MDKSIHERVEKVDQLKLESYIRLYDRMLLYNLVRHILPEEEIDRSISMWDKTVKCSINEDAQMRTMFLESTKTGRLAKLHQAEDGEALRLDSLDAWKVARDIIKSSLFQGHFGKDKNGYDQDEDYDQENN